VVHRKRDRRCQKTGKKTDKEIKYITDEAKPGRESGDAKGEAWEKKSQRKSEETEGKVCQK